MKKKKRESGADKAKYQPTAQEQAALAKFDARAATKPTAPRMEVSDGKGTRKIGLNHPDKAVGYPLLMEALGTADPDFGLGLIGQLANVGSSGHKNDEDNLNFMLSVVKGVKPNDQLEAMLAAQMAAVHMATMRFAGNLIHVETIAQQDSAERTLNKLARTFAIQLEALKRYRTGGEQKVTVQHVSVSEGGQAIVGNVTQSQREDTTGKTAASPPALTDAKATPMLPIEENKECISVPARRKSREK